MTGSLPAWILIGGGIFFMFVAGLGTLRLPDVYCRAHALGKAMTLGMILMLVGLGLAVESVAWWKIAAAIVSQLITIPVASHLLALAAYRQKTPQWRARPRR